MTTDPTPAAAEAFAARFAALQETCKTYPNCGAGTPFPCACHKAAAEARATIATALTPNEQWAMGDALRKSGKVVGVLAIPPPEAKDGAAPPPETVPGPWWEPAKASAEPPMRAAMEAVERLCRHYTGIDWPSPTMIRTIVLAAAPAAPSPDIVVAWLHEIKEPGKDWSYMLSKEAEHPWSRWIASHKDQCEFRSTPLYARPSND